MNALTICKALRMTLEATESYERENDLGAMISRFLRKEIPRGILLTMALGRACNGANQAHLIATDKVSLQKGLAVSACELAYAQAAFAAINDGTEGATLALKNAAQAALRFAEAAGYADNLEAVRKLLT